MASDSELESVGLSDVEDADVAFDEEEDLLVNGDAEDLTSKPSASLKASTMAARMAANRETKMRKAKVAAIEAKRREEERMKEEKERRQAVQASEKRAVLARKKRVEAMEKELREARLKEAGERRDGNSVAGGSDDEDSDEHKEAAGPDSDEEDLDVPLRTSVGVAESAEKSDEAPLVKRQYPRGKGTKSKLGERDKDKSDSEGEGSDDGDDADPILKRDSGVHPSSGGKDRATGTETYELRKDNILTRSDLAESQLLGNPAVRPKGKRSASSDTGKVHTSLGRPSNKNALKTGDDPDAGKAKTQPARGRGGALANSQGSRKRKHGEGSGSLIPSPRKAKQSKATGLEKAAALPSSKEQGGSSESSADLIFSAAVPVEQQRAFEMAHASSAQPSFRGHSPTQNGGPAEALPPVASGRSGDANKEAGESLPPRKASTKKPTGALSKAKGGLQNSDIPEGPPGGDRQHGEASAATALVKRPKKKAGAGKKSVGRGKISSEDAVDVSKHAEDSNSASRPTKRISDSRKTQARTESKAPHERQNAPVQNGETNLIVNESVLYKAPPLAASTQLNLPPSATEPLAASTLPSDDVAAEARGDEIVLLTAPDERAASPGLHGDIPMVETPANEANTDRLTADVGKEIVFKGMVMLDELQREYLAFAVKQESIVQRYLDEVRPSWGRGTEHATSPSPQMLTSEERQALRSQKLSLYVNAARLDLCGTQEQSLVHFAEKVSNGLHAAQQSEVTSLADIVKERHAVNHVPAPHPYDVSVANGCPNPRSATLGPLQLKATGRPDKAEFMARRSTGQVGSASRRLRHRSLENSPQEGLLKRAKLVPNSDGRGAADAAVINSGISAAERVETLRHDLEVRQNVDVVQAEQPNVPPSVSGASLGRPARKPEKKGAKSSSRDINDFSEGRAGLQAVVASEQNGVEHFDGKFQRISAPLEGLGQSDAPRDDRMRSDETDEDPNLGAAQGGPRGRITTEAKASNEDDAHNSEKLAHLARPPMSETAVPPKEPRMETGAMGRPRPKMPKLSNLNDLKLMVGKSYEELGLSCVRSEAILVLCERLGGVCREDLFHALPTSRKVVTSKIQMLLKEGYLVETVVNNPQGDRVIVYTTSRETAKMK